MGNLQRIIYLEQEDYDTLVDQGSITKGGRTIVFNDNDLYITPEDDENSGTGIDFVLSTNTPESLNANEQVGSAIVDDGEDNNNTAQAGEYANATLLGNLAASSLVNGKAMIYMTVLPLPKADHYVQLTLSNNTVTPKYPLYRYGTVQSNTPYPAGTCLLMVFYNNAFYLTTPNGVTI